MSAIEKYIIIKPPTNEEVRDMVFQAMQEKGKRQEKTGEEEKQEEKGFITLTVLSTAEVPPPEPRTLAKLAVRSVMQTPTDVLHIELSGDEVASMRVHADSNHDLPATANIIFR